MRVEQCSDIVFVENAPTAILKPMHREIYDYVDSDLAYDLAMLSTLRVVELGEEKLKGNL